MKRLLSVVSVLVTALGIHASVARGQSIPIRDLVLEDAGGPVRLVGYGLVTGLSGTGDRVTGIYGSRQTVQSIVNLLRRFDLEVPPELLRTRNVAAVLVTAEVSPYLRRGGRFDVTVSSLGDAQSLSGGVLWMTPLVADAGGPAQATAQGSLLLNGTLRAQSSSYRGATSGRVPNGGIVEAELARPTAGANTVLLLRNPNIEIATRIAAVIDSALGGRGNATVLDPGSVALTPKDTSAGFATVLTRIRDLHVKQLAVARLVVDSRDGTIVAGADLRVGPAVISHDGLTIVIGATDDSTATAPTVRAPAGSSVADVARALRAARATAAQTAAVFTALRDAGALTVEVVVR